MVREVFIIRIRLINNIIANKNLDKLRQSFLELFISGRDCNHYLWLLTQCYLANPKNLRNQANNMFVWYPKAREDLKMIHNELYDNLMLSSLAAVRTRRRLVNTSTCLYMVRFDT